MKNKEKYFDIILEIVSNFIGIYKKDNTPFLCEDMDCSKCLLYDEGKRPDNCYKIIREWFEQEYQEPIKLTDDEIVILKNIPKNYKWIARTIGILVIFENAPFKISYNKEFGWDYKKGSSDNIRLFSHLFKFIKNEDEEPYNIDELLKQNGVER